MHFSPIEHSISHIIEMVGSVDVKQKENESAGCYAGWGTFDLEFLWMGLQGQIWNLLYLSQKWSDCHGTKSKHIDWTLAHKCDDDLERWGVRIKLIVTRVTSDVNMLSSDLVFVEIDMLWNYIYAFLIDRNIDGLVQDCNISIANTLEILQSCTKQLLCGWLLRVEIGV